MIDVYNNFLDNKIHKEIYDWVQTVSWYTAPIRQELIPTMSDDVLSKFPFQEYNPKLMGKSPVRVEPNDDYLKAIFKKISFTIYRHPIGWDDKSTKERNPLIWKLWTQINNKIFDGKASLSGMEEGHKGLYGPKKHFVNGADFWEKYKVSRDIKRFTCYVNCRFYREEPKRKRGWGDIPRVGHVHKDSDNTFSTKHFSAVYVVNLKWRPDWSGDLMFFGNENTGAKHWKHGYNIGWPCGVVGNVPNTLIVYPHSLIHRTALPTQLADEMTQKIAFRIKVK